MPIMRWDPWADVATLQREVNQLFDRNAAGGGGLMCPIDAYTTDDGVRVLMDLPGLNAGDVEVTVTDGRLTVSGERTLPQADADGWLRRERPFGRFERSFSLPEGTSVEGINASFTDGVLQLDVPHPAARQPQRIEVSAGNGDTAIPIEAGESHDVES